MWIQAKLIKLWFFWENMFWWWWWWWSQVMHQNTLFWKNHNLMSFVWIHMILVPTQPHFSVLSSYVLTKKRLGIVPGTWFDEKWHFIASNVFFHDILYTVRFVWMRRIQPSHFYYIICVGRQSLQANTIFFDFTLWSWCRSYVITVCF